MKIKLALFGVAFALCSVSAFASDNDSAEVVIGIPELLVIEELLAVDVPGAIVNNYQSSVNMLCPFHTDWECEIWWSKPHVKETIALPSRSIGINAEAALKSAIADGGQIDANAEYARPLVNRYKKLVNAARTCCSAGMVNKLRDAGASRGLIYKFLVDDANFYGFSDRCLMTSNEELRERYPATATAAAVAGVRDICLCQRRDYFDALLAPFDNFSDAEFIYSFKDGLDRDVNVSITNDVQTVKHLISQCGT